MEGVSGDMSQELDSFTVEISSFEETLKTLLGGGDGMKGKTLIILGFLAAAGVILYVTVARRRRPSAPAAAPGAPAAPAAAAPSGR